MKAWYLAFLVCCASCAYRQGAPERVIPGGYSQVRVPMFRNLSQEVGIEVSFTNAMIDELMQAKVAKLSSDAEADVIGTIESVKYRPSTGKKTVSIYGSETVGLAVDYVVVIVIDVSVVKRNSDQVLWTGKFTGERSFSAAQITAPIVNSANPLYNLSARRRNIAELAQDMVAEATDKMTENF